MGVKTREGLRGTHARGSVGSVAHSFLGSAINTGAAARFLPEA